jgi:hypothetical protein
MHLHHELQRALADARTGATTPPLPTTTEDETPDVTAFRFRRSRHAARFRIPRLADRWRRARPTTPLRRP